MSPEIVDDAPLLTDAQRAQFVREGYVKVSGLIPPAVVAQTRERLWDALGMSPEDPRTWPEEAVTFPYQAHPLTAPCRTSRLEAAAAELVGPHFLRGECYSPVLAARTGSPMTPGFIPVLNFPRPGPPAFVPPTSGDHVDGMDTVTLWPGMLSLIVFAYLTDTAAYGGATAVRPGSHRQVFAHWRGRDEAPTSDTIFAGLSLAEAVPLPGAAGDVIFMHYLLVHSGSANHSDHVRVGLNCVIQPDPALPYLPKSGPLQADWTPMDGTLRTDGGVT